MYQGQNIHVTPLEGGFAELCFDRQGNAINKLDARTICKLAEACEAIASSSVRGVLVTSAKSVFIVGSDITEFGEMFRLPRLAGVQLAIDWIANGKPQGASAALAAGLVDAMAAPERVRDEALALLRRAADAEIDWRACQARKLGVILARCSPMPGRQWARAVANISRQRRL